MTASADSAYTSPAHSGTSFLSDSLVLTWRHLKRVPRIPELAVFAILQSVMFVLLFAYIFGGAIPLPGGGSYREFLMPGVFVQTLAFGAATTAVGVTYDLKKGLIDRFRSLPIARSAFLVGRTSADVVYHAGILVVLMLSGLAVGWRVHEGLMRFLAAVGLGLLFVYTMSWLGVWLGLLAPTVEVAQQVTFIMIFPVAFLSNVFVPTQKLPDVLQPIAEWNPVSALTAAMRGLFGNPNPFGHGGFPTEHPVLLTLIWFAALTTVFGSLSVRRYRAMSR